jgi:hypothetical protein
MPLAVVSREPWWYRRAMVLFIMAVAVMPFVPASRRSPRGMTRSIRLATLFLSLAWAAQSGVEAGVDLLVGRVLGFHVTRFDQLAAGLIRPVAVSSSSPGPGGDGGGGGGGRGGSGPGGGGPNDGRRIAYELQNVDETRIAAGRFRAPPARTGSPFPPRTRSSIVAFVVCCLWWLPPTIF